MLTTKLVLSDYENKLRIKFNAVLMVEIIQESTVQCIQFYKNGS